MLNPFPELLPLWRDAPALLRVAAALVFFYLAYSSLMHKNAIAAARWPLGLRGAWIAWFAIVIELLIGGALLAGAYTQYAAIVAALTALKSLSYSRFWPELKPLVFPLSNGTAFLLLAISLSLLLTGAGTHAVDIPL